MGDIDDPDALLFEAGDDAEERLGLGLGQGGRGLVHHDDPGLARQRAGDFDQALLGGRKQRYMTVGIQRQSQPTEQLPGFLAHGPPIDQRDPQSAPQRQIGDEDVFGYAQIRQHRNFLW